MPTATPLEEAFSTHRLRGEALPDDLRFLLLHREAIAGQLGFTLHAQPYWAPWLDRRYARPDQLSNADRAADARAVEEVCARIAFVLASEDGEYFGYWRGAEGRDPVAGAAIVKLDKGGHFNVCPGRRLIEALLSEFSYGDTGRFAELCEWFAEQGLRGLPASDSDIDWPTLVPSPAQVHATLYESLRHRH